MQAGYLWSLKVARAVVIYRNLSTSQRRCRSARIISLRFAERMPKDSLYFGVWFHSSHNGMMTSTFCIGVV
jgi:hypothetical protein